MSPDFLTARPFAHRGLHDKAAGVIENSRAAIEAAAAAGYGVELDVQMSADGEAMVFHDYELQRLTGRDGFARLTTARDLGLTPLSGAADGAGAPTLAEALALIGGRVPALVEIKDQHLALGPLDGRLERRVARTLAAYPGAAAVMSFNPHSVALMAELAPDLPRGRVTCSFGEEDWAMVPAARRAALGKIDDLDALGACFISHQWDELETPPVAAVKQSGRAVLCWTIRSEEEEARARRVADNVTFEGYRA